MQNKIFSSTYAIASLAGFIAGSISGQFVQTLHVNAQSLPEGKPGSILRASRFELVDAHGKVAGVLGISPAGNPSLKLMDGDKSLVDLFIAGGMSHLFLSGGNERSGISMVSGSDWSDISIRGDDGYPRATLSLTANLPKLEFLQAAQKPRFMVRLREESFGPEALFISPEGRNRVVVGLAPNGGGGLYLFDGVRFRGMFANSSEDGTPILTLTDVAGTNRVVASPGNDREFASVSLSDQNGKIRAAIGGTQLETVRTGDLNGRSESSLVLFDKEGKVLWAVP